MDHQWRSPHPVQGSICPTCSTSHFPFCPPHPNPIYPAAHNTPNADQFHVLSHPLAHPNMIRDPFRDPYYRSNNMNVNGYNQYRIQQPSFMVDPVDSHHNRVGYPPQSLHHGAGSIQTGSEYSMNDRTRKRLKVDGTYPSSYATDGGPNPSAALSDENERRLKLIHDHGSGSNGLSPSGQSCDPKLQENPASQVSFASNGYHLNSHIDHSGRQPYGSLHALSVSVENSGEKSYSNAFTHPPYNQKMVENQSLSGYPPRPYAHGFPDQAKHGYSTASHLGDRTPPTDFMPPTVGARQGPAIYQKFSSGSHYGVSENGSRFQPTQEFNSHSVPPLSASSPLPLPLAASGQWATRPNPSSVPVRMSSSLFPADVSSSTPTDLSYPSHSLAPPYPHSSQAFHPSRGPYQQDSQGPQTASQFRGPGQPFPSKQSVSDMPKIVDASSLFKPPNRDKRPDHFVIILRGLPGSGKSYLAKMLRDLEVEHGGNAPRIHSMDDYFMTEVEKVEENETLKSSTRGKKPVVKKVLEYLYEPEMEEAYRASMLKAFKKTLDEGAFTFVIVDDRNLRVADFAQFWATAKRSGYEVYLLQTTYKDPVGCTARNIHGFTRDDIEKMAGIWEEAPPLYLQLDAKSLFHGDDLKESSIQEVDMDMDDEDTDGGSSKPEESKHELPTPEVSEQIGYDVSSKGEKRWDDEADNPDDEAKDLRRSKWSGDLDEDNAQGDEIVKGKSNALSGLLKAYRKEGKSVHWGDQTASVGFSIGAAKKKHSASLIIGPGSGYSLNTNPLPAEEASSSAQSSSDKRSHRVFEERLRAERESFKTVFDRRRQRIGGLGAEEE